MGKTLLITTDLGGSASTSATDTFWAPDGYLHSQTTDDNTESLFRSAGTISNLYCRIITNTQTGNSTLKSRKNGANGNQTVTITGTATGVLEDTSNTDSISAGDKFCRTHIGSTSTGVVTFTIMSSVFDATTDTVTLQTNKNSITGLSAASTNYFLPPEGRIYANTTEANVKFRVRKAGTYKNLGVFLSSNSRTTNTVWTSRKNGAAGNLTVTFGSGVTGWQEDTTHTDSVSAGDDYNTQIANSTGTQTYNFKTQKVEFVSTGGDSLKCCSATPVAITDNTTRWYQVGGDIANTATEANSKMKLRFDNTASNMGLFITANTINASSTVTSRKNGAAGSQTITVTTTATGLFNDTSNTDTLVSTDDISIQYAAASVAGTQTTTISWMSMAFNVVTTTQVNQTFTHLYKLAALVNRTRTHIYKIVGRIAQTYTHKYNIKLLVNRTRTFLYKIIGRVAQTRTHLYKIVGRVARTRTHIYKIVGRIAQTYTHKYNIKLLVTATKTHLYKIRKLATQTYTHLYKIRAIVNRTRTHIYKIVGRAAKTFTHLYKIRMLVNQSYTHLYKLRMLVNRTRTFLYKIVGRASQTYTHIYKIKLLVSQSYTHKYKIRQLVNATKTFIYKIVGRANQTFTHKYKIALLVAQSFTHKYKIRQIAAQTFTHIYNIIADQLRASQTFTHLYKIVGRVSVTKTHKYNIKLLVNQVFTHKYKLRQLVNATKTFLYKIVGRISQTYTHKYKIRLLVNKTFTHLYKIKLLVSQSFIHKYKLIGRAFQIFTHKYKLRQLVSNTKTFVYDIRQLAAQIFTHNYNILILVSQSYTHIYKIFSNVVAQVSQEFTHKYRIIKLVSREFTFLYRFGAFLVPLWRQTTQRKIESGFDAFKWRDRFRTSESFVRQLGNKAVRKYLIKSRRAG